MGIGHLIRLMPPTVLHEGKNSPHKQEVWMEKEMKV